MHRPFGAQHPSPPPLPPSAARRGARPCVRVLPFMTACAAALLAASGVAARPFVAVARRPGAGALLEVAHGRGRRATAFAGPSLSLSLVQNRASSSRIRATVKTSPPSTDTSPPEPYDQTNRACGIVGKYDPVSFETPIYEWWERSGCFAPDAKHGEDNGRDPYVLPMPPPNVTGRLHMGHAIFVALQDVLARFHRMRGRPVLWTPGTDHAGIATQLQVEKRLLAEGTDRKTVGREKFLERVWEYKAEQGGHITRQLRSLGASADWSRERFTMDPELCESVTEAFVRLHDKGLVYRGEYMVNWAPLLQTAVSDLEVEYSEEEGKLYYFKYVLEGGDPDKDFIPVATTRPETIFGDTAVCVNPDDDRFRHLVGKRVMVPTMDRSIPVITDDYVDVEFGTGALKITPGHDPNDYAIGKRHDLPILNIMNRDGTMNAACGAKYDKMERFAAREMLWTDMEVLGLTIKAEPHMQRVPRSQRGGEVIEPLVSSQWFVKTEGMGKKALDAVKDGDITIVPKRFEKIWYNWLEDIHDWCISRQLWWGHRIPVWYIGTQDESEYVVARDDAEAREKATALGHPPDTPLRREDDVLDTWFSSGLWPFATLGWPRENTDLDRFYPSTCLETGYDILFFWVARMAMMGLELTGKSPFSVVYLHGLVRAADGSKMSKTKGNVLDPLDTVAQYGADSLRYSLVTGVTPGQDIPLNMEKIEANRNFANKLWNCCKFVTDSALKGIGEEDLASLTVSYPMSQEDFDVLALPEKYIVTKCHMLVESVTKDIESYQLGEAGRKVYEFLWDEYADWYIEVSKTRLYEASGGGDPAAALAARRILVYVLDTSLRLLHPYMPYVTEHLWHHLPRAPADSRAANALMLADWPQMGKESLVQDDATIAAFGSIQTIIRSIRNARAEYNVDLGKKIAATVVVKRKELRDHATKEVASIISLARLDPAHVTVCEADSPESAAAKAEDAVNLVVQDGVEVYLPMSGLIDPEKERKRLEKQMEKISKEIQKLAGRLNSPGFAEKAPEAVVGKARQELAELEKQDAKIKDSLAAL